jgi:hypothetical protein
MEGLSGRKNRGKVLGIPKDSVEAFNDFTSKLYDGK